MGPCDAGTTRTCYTGAPNTSGVGPCTGGSQTCGATGIWEDCVGEVVPAPETCGDNIDNNCNGMTDEDVDADGDGYTSCGGDCCDDPSICSDPAAVNPGAFEVPGNGVDDNCDGMIDNAVPLCDTGLASNDSMAGDYAKAIDLCQTATMADKQWGVISATLTLADGTGVPNPSSYSIRPKFGSQTMPQLGGSMAVISSGTAAAKGDSNPSWTAPSGAGFNANKSSGFPADFLMANGGMLPNAPNCAAPVATTANDPVMLTLTIRVPTNAHSFSIKSNFYSAEFPEYVCSAFNDFFVMLLDSTFAGSPGNPADKNLAFYTDPNTMMNYPVGVNLANNTGLFTQCVNGATGCAVGGNGSINTCTTTSNLTGTGFDDAASGSCNSNSLVGGATGWLTTTGNVVPGEIIKLRIAIWDTSDHQYDSLALIDAFQWSVMGADPGTVIERTAP
ncbi:MAG: choice-of-anchor L domain-containing protein [Kofleriaceae bacterium]